MLGSLSTTAVATGGGVAPPAAGVPTAAAMSGCEPVVLVEHEQSRKCGVKLRLS